ncbi:MAG: DUF1759 domain-containing protein, partial [Sulfitobacter sp.]|nr:DUF1759 domain-containing protein [Sulfitobacter sp.]
GSLLEYSRWTFLFRGVLDSATLSEDQKLVFLAAALFGDAKDTVDGPISGGASFQECMALLEARYGDKERRIRAIATAMKNWPKMGSFRVPEVRKHRARCTEHLAMLEGFTAEEVRDALVLMMLEDPVPDARGSEWRMLVPTGASATKESFLGYLNKYVLAHEKPGLQIAKFEAKPRKPSSAPPRRPPLTLPPHHDTVLVVTATEERDIGLLPGEGDPVGTRGEPEQAVLAMAGLGGPKQTLTFAPSASSNPEWSSVLGCPICSYPHPLNHCASFLRMGSRERWGLVFGGEICALCLSPGHCHLDCSRPGCPVCQAQHHVSLHSLTHTEEPGRQADPASTLAAFVGERDEAPGSEPLGGPIYRNTAPALCAMARVAPLASGETVSLITALERPPPPR